MPSTTTKTKSGRFKLLGFRAICEPMETPDALRDSWIWLPESSKSKFRAFKILQVGTYKATAKRPAAEVSAGDTVLVDISMGAVEIPDGDRKLRLCSLHDVAALIS